VYGYPVDRAAEVAIRATSDELECRTRIDEVRFVLFSAEDLDVYRSKLSSSVRPAPPDTSSSITGPTFFA